MNTNYYAKIAKNKSLLKEYKTSEAQRSVYLNDGDEFQIQLFNPENTEICARIWIEDSQLSHDIVIRPGERIWLERYTDVAKKFKFMTYVVNGDTPEIRNSISHNGVIKIEFYYRRKNKNYYYRDNTIYVSPNITWTYENPNYVYSTTNISGMSNDSVNNINYTCFSSTLNGNDQLSGVSTLTTTNDNDNTINYIEPTYSSVSFDPDNYNDKKNLETGRIYEGSKSKQSFNNVDMEFEWFAFRTENIKIYPSSRKPYNAKDLKKLYCSNCGRKLNDKYKYCPYCGKKID